LAKPKRSSDVTLRRLRRFFGFDNDIAGAGLVDPSASPLDRDRIERARIR
jgi:hypothetical protein